MEMMKLVFFFFRMDRKVKKKAIKNSGNMRKILRVESGGTRKI